MEIVKPDKIIFTADRNDNFVCSLKLLFVYLVIIIPFIFSLLIGGGGGGGATLSTYHISLLIMIIELVYFVITPTLF